MSMPSPSPAHALPHPTAAGSPPGAQLTQPDIDDPFGGLGAVLAFVGVLWVAIAAAVAAAI